jgi:Uma2 family endonuclease
MLSMKMAPKQIRPATFADLEALPPTWRGEIIDGELYAFPRPAAPHADIETSVGYDLKGPFQRGRGGPGGWWILAEPGIQHPRAIEVSPDVAGWRRERLAQLPAKGPIQIPPDWLCEILSPSTRSYDMLIKRHFYAEIGVRHVWYVDPQARTLTVSRLEGDKWLELGVYGGAQTVRAEPFDAIEISLAPWWESIATPDDTGE